MSSRTARFLILVACGLLSGACATSRYTQSRIAPAAPKSPDGSRRAASGGARAVVRIDGLKLSIETLDRTPEEEAARRLSLRFVFHPGAIGYFFDPGQVVLRAADGREWRGAGSGYRPLYPEATIDVHFDAVIEPGPPLELVVGGLSRGPNRLPPPTFQVAHGQGRSIDRMYWLEAVGYAVMVPLGVASYAGYGGS